jgi:hypothetical protein
VAAESGAVEFNALAVDGDDDAGAGGHEAAGHLGGELRAGQQLARAVIPADAQRAGGQDALIARDRATVPLPGMSPGCSEQRDGRCVRALPWPSSVSSATDAEPGNQLEAA